MDSSGDARIGVPPAGCALLGQSIAIAVEHNVSPFGQHPHAVHVIRVKRPERDSLSVGFPIRESSRFKLNDSEQEPLSVVGRDYLSVRVQPSKSSGP